MSLLFDSHAHYTDKKFDSCEGGARGLLKTLFADGVGWIINVATNITDAENVIALAAEFPRMYAAVGIHPQDAQECRDPDAALTELEKMLACKEKNKIVALGEIGYDYYWQPVDRACQLKLFEAQMALARSYGLPVIIHDRDAHGDCLDMIRRFPDVRGVFHSFSGSPEMAAELTRLGWYISFSGVLTFKNARRTPEAATVIPRDRILIETDCPYLAPEPFRGRLNHSGLMLHTAERLGGLIGLTTDEAVELTARNAAEIFGVSLV